MGLRDHAWDMRNTRREVGPFFPPSHSLALTRLFQRSVVSGPCLDESPQNLGSCQSGISHFLDRYCFASAAQLRAEHVAEDLTAAIASATWNGPIPAVTRTCGFNSPAPVACASGPMPPSLNQPSRRWDIGIRPSVLSSCHATPCSHAEIIHRLSTGSWQQIGHKA
jgi:hypothetical protein